MDVMALKAVLELDKTNYTTGLNEALASAENFETALTRATQRAASFVHEVEGVVIGAVGGFLSDSVKTGLEFDSAMSQVAATLGKTSDEVQDLRDFAIEMGSTTAFTATQSAQALNYMALAGYDAEKSMEMLPNVLSLAAAGAMDLAYASDVVTDLESALGLTSEETATMVDQMARTASSSNTSVAQLGEAMLRVGATAQYMSGGTQELSTVFGLLADNGIKGAEAGTHLRNMLLALATPTETADTALAGIGLSMGDFFDEAGSLKNFSEIIGTLRDSLDGLSDMDKMSILGSIFNDRDIASVNALLNTTSDRWDELQGKLEAGNVEGAAAQMAETQLDNLQGDITLFNSLLDSTKQTISDELNPLLRDLMSIATSGLGTLTDKLQEYLGSEQGAQNMEKLKEAITSIVETLTSDETVNGVMDAIAGAFTALAEGLTWVANNWQTVETGLKAIGTVLAGMTVANDVLKFLNLLSGAKSLFGGGGAAVGTGAGSALGGTGAGALAGVLAKASPYALFGLGVAELTKQVDIAATDREYGAYNQNAAMSSEISALAESRGQGNIDEIRTQIIEAMDADDSVMIGMINQVISEHSQEIADALPDLDWSRAEGLNGIDIYDFAKDIANGLTEKILSTAADEANNTDAGTMLDGLETAVTGIGTTAETDLATSVDTGLSAGGETGGANVKESLATKGLEAVGEIQDGLNNLTFPDFGGGRSGGGGQTRGSGGGRKSALHATGMYGGDIVRGLTPIGFGAGGALHYAGESGAEAVVGVNSLDRMIQSSVEEAMASVLAKMDALISGQGRQGDLKVVLDTGATVGGLVREMDRQLGSRGSWRGGGRT